MRHRDRRGLWLTEGARRAQRKQVEVRQRQKTERYLACHERAVQDGVATMDERDAWMRRHAGEFSLTTMADVFGLTRQRAHQIVRKGSEL